MKIRNHTLLLMSMAVLIVSTLSGSDLPENDSGIDFKAEKYGRYGTCSSTKQLAFDLNQIDVDEDKFRAGVRCISGDFDGNGYLDFVFPGSNYEVGDKQIYMQRDFVFVFFLKNKILEKSSFSFSHSEEMQIYRTDKHKKRLGIPNSDTDRLTIVEEGGCRILFTWENDDRKWKHKTYCL